MSSCRATIPRAASPICGWTCGMAPPGSGPIKALRNRGKVMLHFSRGLKWSGDGPRLVWRDGEQANREAEQKTGASRDGERKAAQQPPSQEPSDGFWIHLPLLHTSPVNHLTGLAASLANTQ